MKKVSPVGLYRAGLAIGCSADVFLAQLFLQPFLIQRTTPFSNHQRRDAIAHQIGQDLSHALDLIITVCTSIVHLAGALGRPVWVLAPAVPEWRYGNAGEKMPWYPAARLFRQPPGGAWRGVIESVKRELEHPRTWNRAGTHS